MNDLEQPADQLGLGADAGLVVQPLEVGAHGVDGHAERLGTILGLAAQQDLFRQRELGARELESLLEECQIEWLEVG